MKNDKKKVSSVCSLFFWITIIIFYLPVPHLAGGAIADAKRKLKNIEISDQGEYLMQVLKKKIDQGKKKRNWVKRKEDEFFLEAVERESKVLRIR